MVVGAYLAAHKGAESAAALGGVAALLVVPRYWLPAAALAAFVLVPVQYLHVPTILTYVTPATIVVVFYVIRGARFTGGPLNGVAPWVSRVMVVLVGWLVVTSIFGIDFRDSTHWDVPFLVSGALLAVLAGRDRRASERIRSAWLSLASILALYAFVEVLVLKNNPLFGQIYASAPGNNAFVQYTVWSTYRATTTLGHPLLNATFFACAASLALGAFLRRGSPRMALVALLSVGAVLLTASRSGVGAVGAGFVGAAFVSALSYQGRRGGLVRILAASGMIAAVGLSFGGAVLTRQTSAEGAASVATRGVLAQEGFDLASLRPLTGFGPGTLADASLQYGSNPTGDYENSYVELADTIGYPGLVLVVLMYLALLSLAASRRDAGVFAAVLAYAVSQGGYNLLDGYPGAIVLLGALGAMAIAGPPQVTKRSCIQESRATS